MRETIPTRPEDTRRAEASAQRLRALGYDAGTLDGLARALSSTNVAVRAEAAFLLGHARDRGACEILLQSLKDSDARVRVEAALALARAGGVEDEVRAILVDELSGELFEDAPLRAARALALLGDPAGYGRVIEALESELPSNRMEAINVLPVFLPFKGRAVEGQVVDVVAALERAAVDAEPILRRDALRLLAETADPRARVLLRAALDDAHADVRDVAQSLLSDSEEGQ